MKRLKIFGLFIVVWFTTLAQTSTNPKDDFTAVKVNEYLDKYGLKVAGLTDQIVLDGTLKNAGVFYSYSTLNSFIKLYSLSHEGLSPIDYFNESLKFMQILFLEPLLILVFLCWDKLPKA